MPGTDFATDDGLRALEQAPQQRAKTRCDDESHQERPHTGALARNIKSGFGASAEPCCLSRFLRVTLDYTDGVEHLGGDGAAVGHAVLAGP